jgi:hypothetical protein
VGLHDIFERYQRLIERRFSRLLFYNHGGMCMEDYAILSMWHTERESYRVFQTHWLALRRLYRIGELYYLKMTEFGLHS